MVSQVGAVSLVDDTHPVLQNMLQRLEQHLLGDRHIALYILNLSSPKRYLSLKISYISLKHHLSLQLHISY